MIDYRITHEKRNKLQNLGRAMDRCVTALRILPNTEDNRHMIKVYEDELEATIEAMKEELK